MVRKGFTRSRNKAAALIMAGEVKVEGMIIDKPGKRVPVSAAVSLTPRHPGFVSRGGVKLAAALHHFSIPVQGRTFMDVGSSTGGFTDCLLRHGARRVFGIDVGYGQVAMALRRDPRVTLFERRNFRHFDPGLLDEAPTLAVVDVSFISLTLILPKLKDCLDQGGLGLVMVKPQFELYKALIGKGGVVRDDSLREEAVSRVTAKAMELGFEIRGRADSRLPGPKGNREVFLKLALQVRQKGPF